MHTKVNQRPHCTSLVHSCAHTAATQWCMVEPAPTYTHAHTHACTHACTLTHTRMHTHARTHTRTQRTGSWLMLASYVNCSLPLIWLALCGRLPASRGPWLAIATGESDRVHVRCTTMNPPFSPPPPPLVSWPLVSPVGRWLPALSGSNHCRCEGERGTEKGEG